MTFLHQRWEETCFSVHSDLLETSEVFAQTVGAGIPSAEQKTQLMSGDTLHSYTPEKAVLLLGYWRCMKKFHDYFHWGI